MLLQLQGGDRLLIHELLLLLRIDVGERLLLLLIGLPLQGTHGAERLLPSGDLLPRDLRGLDAHVAERVQRAQVLLPDPLAGLIGVHRGLIEQGRRASLHRRARLAALDLALQLRVLPVDVEIIVGPIDPGDAGRGGRRGRPRQHWPGPRPWSGPTSGCTTPAAGPSQY